MRCEPEQKGDCQQQVKISSKNNDDQQPWNAARYCQSQKDSAQQRFIGDWVQIRAELAGEVKSARRGAIEDVSERRAGKKYERKGVPSEQDGPDDGRNQNEPQNCEEIR